MYIAYVVQEFNPTWLRRSQQPVRPSPLVQTKYGNVLWEGCCHRDGQPGEWFIVEVVEKMHLSVGFWASLYSHTPKVLCNIKE